MKISKVRVLKLIGPKRDEPAVFEEEHPYLTKMCNKDVPYEQTFTFVETDEGPVGISLGGFKETKELGELLIGENPLRVEYLWERLYTAKYVRFQYLQSIGILDLALWDLIGKIRGEPVFQLLGGPFREKVPAYAAMLGFSTEPSRAAEASVKQIEKGFRVLKWYLPYNETFGEEGFKRNVELVAAVRRAVGDDIGIAVDFGVSGPEKNSLLYVINLARELEKYNVMWLEEPLNIDDVEAYVRLSKRTSIPLACGERWYNRWQIKELVESGAVSVLQPDPYFAMGITELRKIISLVSVYGLSVIPHANESCVPVAHLLFASPERICPMGEFGVKLNRNFQWFFSEFYAPVEGYFLPPKGPGFGWEIDWGKVVEKVELE